jgi:tetratricopeptide (TPR) repeat protein
MVTDVEPKRALALGLILATLVAYVSVLECDFVNLDDPKYVTANAHVRAGLSAGSVRWALVSTDASLWHPVTWLSHMMDVELYGLNPAGHHFTNLILHLANVVLLFLVLDRVTGAVWPSAMVAGLFGLHPLRVESVAWVAERKDLLSVFFALLTVWAYARYVERPGVARFVVVGLCLALALMSKPMLVTLPFVLLLLDYWPLRRLGLPPERDGAARRAAALLAEKAPLLALSAAASAIAVLAVGGHVTVGHLEPFPAGTRVANALVSYAKYLGTTLWPSGLAAFYPYPSAFATVEVLGATVALCGASALALATARSRPYLVVGWFWFLGTLVPVVGLVQAGSQAMADRFTYFPHIGFLVALAWGLYETARRRRSLARPLAACTVLVLGALGFCTYRQVQHWRDSKTLFTRALEVTTGNWLAYNNLGDALVKEGRLAEAAACFEESLRLLHANPDAHYNLGVVRAGQGRVAEAAVHYRAALHFDPTSANAHNNLGLVLLAEGRAEEAARELAETLRLRADAVAHFNLGLALTTLRQVDRAAQHFEAAVALMPRFAEAHYHLARSLAHQGRHDDADRHHSLALQIRPDLASVEPR